MGEKGGDNQYVRQGHYDWAHSDYFGTIKSQLFQFWFWRWRFRLWFNCFLYILAVEVEGIKQTRRRWRNGFRQVMSFFWLALHWFLGIAVIVLALLVQVEETLAA
jgi:hypothetical protein